VFQLADFESLHGLIMEVKLVVLDGDQRGCEIPLPETVFVIGRNARCHLRPHCPSVSKLHCAIASWAGLVRVQDLKSRNGTLLNGDRIAGEVAAKDGDRLQIGTLSFEFRIKVLTGSPVVPPIEPEQVEWLLEEEPDTQVLSNGRQTEMLPALTVDDLEPRVSGNSLRERKKHRSKAVSAGQNFRDYFELRKS